MSWTLGAVGDIIRGAFINSFQFYFRFIDGHHRSVPLTLLIIVIESGASRCQYTRHRRFGREYCHAAADPSLPHGAASALASASGTLAFRLMTAETLVQEPKRYLLFDGGRQAHR